MGGHTAGNRIGLFVRHKLQNPTSYRTLDAAWHQERPECKAKCILDVNSNLDERINICTRGSGDQDAGRNEQGIRALLSCKDCSSILGLNVKSQ